MKHHPIAAFIPSFDDAQPSISDALLVSESDGGVAVEPAFPPNTPRQPPPDLDGIFESGRQAGLTEARAEALRERADLRAETEAALAAERLRWADDVALPFSSKLDGALSDLGETLSDSVGRLLRPFLATEMRDAACRALMEQISPLLAGADGALIRVGGPPPLLAALRVAFPRGKMVDFVETDAVEVTIVSRDTVIETRLAEWAARLEGRGPDRRRRSPATT